MAYSDYTRVVNLPKTDGSGYVPVVFSPAHEYPLCSNCKHHAWFENECKKFGAKLYHNDVSASSEYCPAGYEDRVKE